MDILCSDDRVGVVAVTRKCGKCTECCTLIEVPPLDKPAGKHCDFQTHKGCDIYEKRPECCKAWNCLWLQGLLPKRLRPNKVGAVGSMTRIGGLPVWQFTLRRELAIDAQLWGIIQRLAARNIVQVIHGDLCELRQNGERLAKWNKRTQAISAQCIGNRLVNVTVETHTVGRIA